MVSLVKARLKRAAAVAGFVVAATISVTGASAATVVLNPGPFGTADFGRSTVIGSFTDTINFTTTVDGIANAVISSQTYANGRGNISFTSIVLDGLYAFTPLSTGLFEFYALSPVAIGAGEHAIVLTGTSNGNRRSPASYAGTLNVSPVPEPAAWGMMLLGFGIVGAGMRSRRRSVVLA
jgi:hypothetical protein